MRPTNWIRLLALVVVLSLIFTGIVYAITITVDGIRESAWDGQGGQTPGNVADTTEDTTETMYDISRFQFTNNTSTMFFLLETVANTYWEGGTSYGTVRICLDYTTGGGSTPGCSFGQGSTTDSYLTCTPYLSSCQVRRWNGTTFALVTGASTAVAYQDKITEFSVDIASLMEGTCYSNMNAFVYYDNGDLPSEDYVLNTGSFTMSCGNPNAISLSRAGARTFWPYLTALAFILTGLTLRLRKHRQS